MSLVTLDGSAPGYLQTRRTSGSLAAARAGVQGSFAVVGYLGKNWHLKYRGEDTVIRDGSGKAAQELDVVIVGAAKSISKNYYGKTYSKGDDSAPDCFSLDGKVPDATSPKKQHATCDGCPQNQWGSQMTPDGKKAKACRDSRRLAVVPYGDIKNEGVGGPMLLRLPPTTLLNFASYADFLERKGAPELWSVGTKLGFDPEFAYPRITFSAIAYVTEEQDAEIAEVLRNPLIERLLYAYGPTESAPAAEVDDSIPGTPPKRQTVVSLPARAAPSDPPPPEEPEEDEEEAPPPPPEEAPPAPAPAAKRVTPFQAATAPAPTGRRASTTARTKPVAAPSDLENAIDDLLDQPA